MTHDVSLPVIALSDHAMPLPAEATKRWTLSLATPQDFPAGQPILIPTGWGMAIPSADLEGRVTLHEAVSDKLELVNRPCGTIDADYVGEMVGLILRTKRGQPFHAPAGTAIGYFELHRKSPAPGTDGSPVSIIQGTAMPATGAAACSDLTTALRSELFVNDDGLYTIPLDIKIEVAARHFATIRSRSGLSLKHGFSLAAPCPVQTASFGDIQVPLTELVFEKRGGLPLVITPGMRIAQIGCAPLEDTRVSMQVQQVTTLKDGAIRTNRTGGFGHTG